MMCSTPEERRRLESLDRNELTGLQLSKLNRLLSVILPENRFYAGKLEGLSLPLASIDRLYELPYTFKEELVAAHHEETFTANLTFPPQRYVRFHQTSGTRGRPLVVLDTAADWEWLLECWQFRLDAAGITANDRVFMAFSFGPFIGLWGAYEAASARGCMVVPGGGMGTVARLELIRVSGATVVFCTPSYAMRIAEIACERQIDLPKLPVRLLVLAGEPGGSIPSMRTQICEAWGADVHDQSGATEVGPWGYADKQGRGLHLLESEFVGEFISVETGAAAKEGEVAELVVTNLGRPGCPLLRYRTGDLVRPVWEHGQRNRFVLFEGGVLGRNDDMMIIRGVNVFPSAIEQILRSFPEVAEYRMTASKLGEMDELVIEVEDRLDRPARIADALRLRLSLRVEVQTVDLGSLPRFEGKGRRFVDNRPIR